MAIFYRQEMTIGGDFAMITAVPVWYAPYKRQRRPRCNPTKEAQAWVNKKNAEDRLFYLVHENFGLDDYRLGLDFIDDCLPGSLSDLKRIMRNFWKRLRRIYERHGVELRYIWVAEMSYSGRYHVHGFLPGGVPREKIERAWGNGHANCAGFQYDREGLRAYCNYVLKSPILSKSWCGSRNLRQPQKRRTDYALRQKDVAAAQQGDFALLEQRLKSWRIANEWQIEEIEVVEPEAQVQMPWAVTDSAVRYNEVNGMPYLYIRLCRRDARLSY